MRGDPIIPEPATTLVPETLPRDAATRLPKTRYFVSVVLLLLGISLVSAAGYAHGLVAEHLGAQLIVMPDTRTIDAKVSSGHISAEDAQVLRRFVGQEMTNGVQAQAYADHYIQPHMRALAVSAGVPADLASYTGIGIAAAERTEALRQEILADPKNDGLTPAQIASIVNAEIANPNTQYPDAQQAALLQQMRADSFLTGDLLRGLLLNAYGWWLLGSISQIVGVVALLAGTGTLAWTFRAHALAIRPRAA